MKNTCRFSACTSRTRTWVSIPPVPGNFSGNGVTNAQQDNGLRGLKRAIQTAETLVEGNLGVIRFPVDDRQSSPYFLEKGDQGWMLDFYTMNQVIRFNHKNQWHFVKTEHKYAFAFTDLRFDKHGFPHQ